MSPKTSNPKAGVAGATDGVELSAVDMNVSDAVLGAAVRRMLQNLGDEEVVAFGHAPLPRGPKKPSAGKVSGRYGAVRKAEGSTHFPGSVEILMNLGADKGHMPPDPKVPKDMPVRGARRGKTFKLAKFVEINDPVPITADPLEQALQAAEERGIAASKAVLAGDGMLTSTELAELIGISRQAIDKRRKSNQLLGLQGGPKTYKYPRWQVLPTGQIIEGLKTILARVDGDAWTAYRLLVETFPDASGLPVYEHLKRGRQAEVLNHIDAVLGGSTT